MPVSSQFAFALHVCTCLSVDTVSRANRESGPIPIQQRQPRLLLHDLRAVFLRRLGRYTGRRRDAGAHSREFTILGFKIR